MSDRYYEQTVERHIPVPVYWIVGVMYAFTALFALIGAAGGLAWGVVSVALLVGAWYLMGQARVTYRYKLEGTRLNVLRTSGFRSRPQTEDFATFDLSRLEAISFFGDASLEEMERALRASPARPARYNVSRRGRDDEKMVMYLKGIERDHGRDVRVVFSPDAQMRRLIAGLRPSAFRGASSSVLSSIHS